MSRLGGFASQHPEIEIRIETSVQLADMASGMVDVAIRHGSGDYPGLDAALLFSPRFVAVASPSLLLDGPLNDPAECLLSAPAGSRPGRLAGLARSAGRQAGSQRDEGAELR